MIHGNLEGIRQSTLDELEKLYDAQFARDEYLPDRLLNALVRFTMQLNRELLVYLDRNGVVLEVAIGSIASISLPELHLRRNLDRLSGYRCIHTHPGGDARLSDVDVQALRLLRFDSMCSVGVAEDRATGIMAAFLGEAEYDRLSIVTFGPVKPGRIPQSLWMREIETAEERVKLAIERGGLTETAERAMLISTDSEDSLDELAALAETAGALVVSRVLQKRQRPDPGTFIGSGKAAELALDCQALEVDLAILDDELTGAQQRNLENALGVRVIDRTALILDIFAARAQTAEGKLQVELAQMKYRLPRLVGLGQSLSRLGGGIVGGCGDGAFPCGPAQTDIAVSKGRGKAFFHNGCRELFHAGGATGFKGIHGAGMVVRRLIMTGKTAGTAGCQQGEAQKGGESIAAGHGISSLGYRDAAGKEGRGERSLQSCMPWHGAVAGRSCCRERDFPVRPLGRGV